MFKEAKDFIDNKIDRRTFMSKLKNVGISTLGASTIASSLSIPADSAASTADSTAEPSRFIENITGGELMAEFLIEWGVP